MMRMSSVLVAACALSAASALASCSNDSASSSDESSFTVFVAASMVDVMSEIASSYQAANGVEIRVNAASTSTLARQLEHGARADVFVAANPQWMQHVVAHGIIDEATTRTLCHNRLVIVLAEHATDTGAFDFAAAAPTHINRLAIGDPEHVPAGLYAKESLQSLGWWTALQSCVIPVIDVRAALRLVEIGEADCGIVYATDAALSTVITQHILVPEHLHTVINYEIGAHHDASNEARGFLTHCFSDSARASLAAHGFQLSADQVDAP